MAKIDKIKDLFTKFQSSVDEIATIDKNIQVITDRTELDGSILISVDKINFRINSDVLINKLIQRKTKLEQDVADLEAKFNV